MATFVTEIELVTGTGEVSECCEFILSLSLSSLSLSLSLSPSPLGHLCDAIR